MVANSKTTSGFLGNLSGGVSFGKGGFNPVWLIAGLIIVIAAVVLKK